MPRNQNEADMAFMRKILQRMGTGIGSIHRRQGGQAMVFASVTMGLLALFSGAIFRIGIYSSNKMKTQSVADAAAYSMAVNQANALSALGWINEGMAIMHYNLCRYAVDVIISAVDLEFSVPGPRAADRQALPTSSPHNADPGGDQTKYDDAYAKASKYIPLGKQYLRELGDAQQIIITSAQGHIIRSAIHESVGAAFSMTEGNSGRRGVRVATIYPDYDELDLNNMLEQETDPERFGYRVGLGGAHHPSQGSNPQWMDWFDSGLRGSSTWGGCSTSWNYSTNYWDKERTSEHKVNVCLRPPIRRTWARMGRLLVPTWRPSAVAYGTHLVEKLYPNDSRAYHSEGGAQGRGYAQGDTVIRVANVRRMRDSSDNGQPQDPSNPYRTPFFVQLGSVSMGRAPYTVKESDLQNALASSLFRMENGKRVQEKALILEVVTVNEQTHELTFQNPLPYDVFIYPEYAVNDPLPDRPCDYGPTTLPNGRIVYPDRRPYCETITINGTERHFRRSYPSVSRVRYLIPTDSQGNELEAVYARESLGDHSIPNHVYAQTRGPCWDTREILITEIPGGAPGTRQRPAEGPTGFIFENNQVNACPTCGYGGASGVDFDGDGKTDVRLSPWFTYDMKGTTGLNYPDENDFMDVRVWEEMNEFGESSPIVGDRFDTTNAYGQDPAESPLVLTEEAFKYGHSAAVWMPISKAQLILPADWEPQWGFFSFASARVAGWDTFQGQWINDWADQTDPKTARQSWLDSDANLYITNWQARLHNAGKVIQDFDAGNYSNGFQMLIDNLTAGATNTYDADGNGYDAVVGGGSAPTPSYGTMNDVIQELLNPTNLDAHGLDLNNSAVRDLIRH
jgi:hypothetical protein